MKGKMMEGRKDRRKEGRKAGSVSYLHNRRFRHGDLRLTEGRREERKEARKGRERKGKKGREGRKEETNPTGKEGRNGEELKR
jgi:hypothetical protein